jgi:LCP family protein required for cell wall assembly
VSIPRDTIVDRGEGENPKLVYGKGGVDARRQEISEMLGIPIDYYIKINLKAFVAVVNQLGGVDFYVPCDMNYDDPYQDLHIHFKEGMQHLDGQAVMEVARFRQNSPDENGKVTGYWDTGRTDTQQKLLIALAKKVLSWNSLTKINGFVEIFNQYVSTDLSMSDMLYFASQAIYVDTANGVNTATLTGEGDARYKGQSYCFQLDKQSTLDTVNALINPYNRDLEMDELNIFTVK